jgi:hypothetical protein
MTFLVYHTLDMPTASKSFHCYTQLLIYVQAPTEIRQIKSHFNARSESATPQAPSHLYRMLLYQIVDLFLLHLLSLSRSLPLSALPKSSLRPWLLMGGEDP